VTGVHLQRAVDGELRRAAQVGAEGRLRDMSLSDGGEDCKQLSSGEHHGGEVYEEGCLEVKMVKRWR